MHTPLPTPNFTRRPPLTLWLLTVVAMLGVSVRAGGQPNQTRPKRAAEEDRLNTGIFRAALKKRGLTELLNLHRADFPPTNEVDALRLARDIKLAEFADRSRTPEHRQAAIAEANTILRRLIAEHGDDLRQTEWRFALVRSILYQEAEPLITSILYRGGREDERKALRPLTEQAVATSAALIEHLHAEYKRIDAMSVSAFERLEKKGYVERLDQLEPQIRYVQLWAWFYDSLSYGDNDPRAAERLAKVRSGMSEMRSLLTTPHEQTGVQVQAHTLLGMTYRRLNQHRLARGALRQAVLIGARMADPTERTRVAWAIQLARIELIRNERRAGRFSAAMDAVDQLKQSLTPGEANFGLWLVAAMETRDVQRDWSIYKENRGETVDAAAHRKASWRALLELTRTFPKRRDEIYGIVYQRLDPATPADMLDPFERSAVLAGLLSEAAATPDHTERLRRVIERGESYLALTREESPVLAAEMWFHIAIAEYHLGLTRQAAKRFLSLSVRLPLSDAAPRAARLAVELAAKLNKESDAPDPAKPDTLYLDALTHLVTQYPQSDAGIYWRFFYAQQLDQAGRFDDAAAQYERVAETHEHYIESRFLQLRAMTLSLTALSDHGAINELEAHRRMDDVFEVYRSFVVIATRAIGSARDDSQKKTWHHLLARARVLTAEAQVLPSIDRLHAAIDTIAGFETTFPHEPALEARVWRVRLRTYQQLGQLEQAAQAIPAYLAAEPANAGPTLQALFTSLADELRYASFDAADQNTSQKAALALLLAQQIDTWTEHAPTPIAPAMRRAVRIQLAEAHLWAGHYEQAKKRFDALDARVNDNQDQRILWGRAEALFRLQQYEDALPLFNTLAGGLRPSDPIRWRSLLRDLQCRDALHHDPNGIIRVIEQQSFLFPELGGPALASQFQKLLRDNQRRRDAP